MRQRNSTRASVNIASYDSYEAQCRLERSRPDPAAVAIAQVAVHAPRVAGHVLAPARQRADPASGCSRCRRWSPSRDSGRSTAVASPGGGCRPCGTRATEPVAVRRHCAHRSISGSIARFAGRARHALLQQQQGRLELRIGFEAALHRPIEQYMRGGEQAHALVVGHERTHDRARLAGRQARRRVVDRFVETVRPSASPGAPYRAGCRPLRAATTVSASALAYGAITRSSARPRLQAEARHAERAVLVVLRRIGQVVAGFGNAPRHVALRAVVDLPRDRGLAGLRRAACLEMPASPAAASGTRTSSRSTRAGSARPRARSAGGRARTSCSCGDLSVRDRDEDARRPRMRAGRSSRVAPAFADVVADREQMRVSCRTGNGSRRCPVRCTRPRGVRSRAGRRVRACTRVRRPPLRRACPRRRACGRVPPGSAIRSIAACARSGIQPARSSIALRHSRANVCIAVAAATVAVVAWPAAAISASWFSVCKWPRIADTACGGSRSMSANAARRSRSAALSFCDQ